MNHVKRLLSPIVVVTLAYQPNVQTAWETPRLLANGLESRSGRAGGEWNREQLRYLNATDEELSRGLEVSWKNEGRPLQLASGA